MSTSNNIGGEPIVITNPQPGDILVRAFPQGPGPVQWVNQPLSAGPTLYQQSVHVLEQEVTVVGSEVVLGRAVIDPVRLNIATGAFSFGLDFKYLAIITDGGGTPSWTVRVYDIGAPNSPITPVLRTTFPVQGSPNYSTPRWVTRSVSAVSSPGTNTNEIHDVERLYEIRGEITGSAGDSVETSFLGFEI